MVRSFVAGFSCLLCKVFVGLPLANYAVVWFLDPVFLINRVKSLLLIYPVDLLPSIVSKKKVFLLNTPFNSLESVLILNKKRAHP